MATTRLNNRQLLTWLNAEGAGPLVTLTTYQATGSVITLPANFLYAGRTIRLRSDALYSATGLNPTLNVMAFLNGITGIGDGITQALGTNTAGRYHLDWTFTCQSAGSSGAIHTGGFIIIETNAAVTTTTLIGGNPGIVDTTSPITVGLYARFGTTGNSLQDYSQIITVEG